MLSNHIRATVRFIHLRQAVRRQKLARALQFCTPATKPITEYKLLVKDSAPTMSTERFASSTAAHLVKLDSEGSTFYIDVEGKGRAFLEYERNGDHIKLLHTEVPAALEGSGLGKVIANAALEFVAKNNLSLEIECDFVEHYVKKYAPEYLKYTQMKNNL